MPLSSLHLLFSEKQISEHITDIATELNTLYQGKDVIMVCVLKGAFMFFADLVKQTIFAPTIDFLGIASYGENTTASDITLYKDVQFSLAGKHIILVEDIVDSGQSLQFLQQHFLKKDIASFCVVTLLDKKARRTVSINPDRACFTIDDGFVVGYGLDYNQKYRELPAIYTLEM